MEEKTPCRWDYTDRNRTIIKCLEHGEREVLKAITAGQTIAQLNKAGTWVGPVTSQQSNEPPPSPEPDALQAQQPRAVAVRSQQQPLGDLVAYQTFEGRMLNSRYASFSRCFAR